MSYTPRYGLQRVRGGENFSLNGNKFSDDDRLIIENLIYASLTHHHNGLTSTAPSTSVAPGLVIDTAFGSLPSGQRVFYTTTWVDNIGNESVALPEAYIDTSPSVTNPGTPYLIVHSTGGTLTPGNYYYVLSAYTGSTAYESKATNPQFDTVQTGGITNSIVVGFPAVPAGADGFNVYRRGPGEIQYSYLTTVAVTGGASPSPASFTDDGSLTINPVRTIPAANTTNSVNNITITVPSTTIDGVVYPDGTVPPGYTWKVYRSYTSGLYTNTLVHHVVEFTGEFTGIIVGSFTDTGFGTQQGTPPVQSQFVGSPSPIDLATETTGIMPPERSEYNFVLTFSIPGSTIPQTGIARWVCEYTSAVIVGCRVSTGRGEPPAGTSVIVDVLKGTGVTPSPTTVYTTTGNRPSVAVGKEIGLRTIPDLRNLLEGDSLTVDLIQGDSAATPTAADLTVNVFVRAGAVVTASDSGHGTSTASKTP